MPVACIDTHILIWGIQGRARAGQEDMILRTQALLAQLDRDNTQVIVPSIVIGEFLLGLPITEHPRYQELLNRRFMVVPYDLRAALHFSRIWHQKKDANIIATMKQEGATKNELRADTMIVATALAAGATCIYGHDAGVGRLSTDFITFHNIDQVQVQMPLLDIPNPH